jgi:signal transduction histidine kinase
LYAHNITDSLNNILKQTSLTDSTKLQLYKLLAEEIRHNSPYQALMYAQQAIEIAEKTKAQTDLVECLTMKGIIYYTQGNYSFSLDYLYKSLEISEKYNLIAKKAHIEKWISILFYHQKNYQQALDYANKSLQTCEGLRDRKKVALALANIALIYLDKKDYHKSIYYFNKAIPVLKILDEKQALADTQINLLNVYMALQNFPKAIELCNTAYTIYQELEWKQGEELALINYGEIYQAMDNMPKSLEYYQKALQVATEIDNNIGKVFVFNKIADLYMNKQLLSEAEIYATQALNLSKQINAKMNMKESYEILYRIYKIKGVATKALYYYELERQITDSIFNYERDKLLANMHKDYELEKNTEVINKLNQHQEELYEEVEKQITWKNMLLSTFVFLLIMMFYLWYNNREKRKINKTLKEQQAKLLSQSVSFKRFNQELLEKNASKEQLYEKLEQFNRELEQRVAEKTNALAVTMEKLVQQNQDLVDFSNIVSHNLKSPVASLKGLVDMHKSTDYTKNPEMINILLSHIEKSMQKLDIVVYDLNAVLNVRESITKVYELIDLQEITWEVIHTRLSPELLNSNAILDTDFMPNTYFLGIKSYVENVIYQLVSNAIKYRDTSKQLHIVIKTYESGENEICLSVKDNGLGVPNPAKLFQFHQRQHIHIEGTGLGLYLIATQLKAMNGRADVVSKDRDGAEFLIYFKRS